MKLATLRNGTRDGQLVVISRDNRRFVAVPEIAPTLQAALDDWDALVGKLQARFEALTAGAEAGQPTDGVVFDAPLPRAYEWVDGSAYINHIVLVRKARNAEPPATLETDPLVYQGGSGKLLGPTDDIPQQNPEWGLDFEGEMVCILGDTPRGTAAAEAGPHIKLVTLCNDVTLRNRIPPELQKGFGFFTSKPATAFAPFAVTPDELGEAWQGGRLHLNLKIWLNGEVAGDVAAGPEMHFSFHDLIAHITQTRDFTAGTLLGSGTVSNEDETAGVSCLAERRMREIIATGKPSTRFLKAGDHVRIEMFGADGSSLFGAIDQKVVEG
ncbi:MAG: fumarylacetoacetate hydrolase family protein [Myxococcales bacterium]|nr:fumarylacetoacetate hydrolase family protein [Myxococcales bacterium]MCB9524959.1 fumarylacetoacetate hydrolase family protein [Myxococcales bacterium]